jgi:uncharacterized DUF497 family protein
VLRIGLSGLSCYKKLFSRPYFVIQKAMNFEWDSEKSDQNLAERGFGFDLAVLIFEGVTLEKEDRRKNYGEKRIQAIAGPTNLFFSSFTQIARTLVGSFPPV